MKALSSVFSWQRGLVVGALLIATLLVGFALRGASVRSSAPPSTVPGSPGQSGAPATAAASEVPTPPAGPMLPTAARTSAAGTVVVQGAWGGAPGQFGRRRDPESNPEAPMAVAAGPAGQLAVVDQVNRRILRYKNGKLSGTVDLGGDTVQDLTLTRDGRLLVLDRLADGNVQSYGPDGKLLDTLSLGGKGVTDNGGVTGLFTDDDGIYVERDHESVVRIADASGRADPARPELLGRPSRDGRLLLAAAIGDRSTGDVVVRAVDRSTGLPAWEQAIRLGAPIVHIVALDSDRRGMIYLAVDVGHEAPTPPYALVDEKLVIARLGGGGAPRGVLETPPLPAADESFRPVTVDDDGTVFVMAGGDNGLTVTRYVFP
ncbi:MAG: hypothetical protein JWN44_2818 [Myxococcales bacterium]|nr:hypothetical protein [Myxococcales bacterium]